MRCASVHSPRDSRAKVESFNTFTPIPESMRINGLVALALFCGILPLAATRAHAQAQAADSTGFRAGQWGAEFSLGSGALNSTGAGVLRFTSARRALVLDVQGQLSRDTGDGDSRQTQSGLRVRLGTRWYRSLSRNVLQSLTVGVLASHDRREWRNSSLIQVPAANTRSTFTGGGAFAELGGSWMVTPQLSLGAAWQGSVQYSRGTQRTVSGNPTFTAPNERTTSINASLGGVVLRAGGCF